MVSLGTGSFVGTISVRAATLRAAIIRHSGEALEPWMARVADRICATSGLELCGQIEHATATPQRTMSLSHRLWWKLEAKAVAKPAARQTPGFDAVEKTLPTVDSQNLAAVEALDADVIIDLTSGGNRSGLLNAARYGVWFLDFLTAPKGGFSIRAISDNAPTCEIKLCQTRPENSAPVVISNAILNVKLFASLNHLFMCEKSVSLIVRELKRLSIRKELETHALPAPVNRARPGFFSIVKYGFSVARRCAKRIIEVQAGKLSFRPGEFFLQTSNTDLHSVDPARMQEHHSPENGYFADPFLWERGDDVFCFFEHYNYADDFGYIAVGRLVDGELIDIQPAVKTDYHMSFPFLYEDDDGDLFMIPEACSKCRIETWKCIEFPHQWERVNIVLDDVVAADTSLAKIDEEWWLFTNISNDPFGEMSSELHVFKADGPGLTQLTPHPLNPVVFDTRTARNGGRVIDDDGEYYRISQDNSHGVYGYGVNTMKIEHISMNDYLERLTRKIEPNFRSGISGSHHMDTRASTVVMDVRKQVGGRRWFPRKNKAATSEARHQS